MVGIGLVGALIVYAVWPKAAPAVVVVPVVPVPTPTVPVPVLTAADRAFIRAIQDRLRVLGYTPGPTTGDWSHDTNYAIATFQRANGLLANGVVDGTTATRIQSRYEAEISRRAANDAERQTALGAAQAAWASILNDVVAGARQGFGPSSYSQTHPR
jgi:peptidoglycan hydrolase-like protein with peptidoglycan-binding domain